MRRAGQRRDRTQTRGLKYLRERGSGPPASQPGTGHVADVQQVFCELIDCPYAALQQAPGSRPTVAKARSLQLVVTEPLSRTAGQRDVKMSARAFQF